MMRRGRPTWTASALAPVIRRRLTEAAMVGAIVARGRLADTVIVSDDAGQFDVFQHALCWIHAERHLRRIICVSSTVWSPCSVSWSGGSTPALQRRSHGRPPDGLADTLRSDLQPGHRLRRARRGRRPDPRQQGRTAACARPPRHPAAYQRLGERRFVTKRKISGDSAAGKQARDTFLSLLKTCSKLAISFWDYLGARLKIPDADRVPWLPDLIRQNVSA